MDHWQRTSKWASISSSKPMTLSGGSSANPAARMVGSASPFGGGVIGNVGQIFVGLVYQAVDFNHQPIILQTVSGADGQPTIALSLNG
ncbi:uncharacterized protein PGTG_20849 [Puccinia graminis f. sp. tritici CRL 75-36-700-3]|uniref:Uncharacterized protein n=1 Tax=Puccinia graminis f. sp. tritici (strain CRL 75-36-700-3 / race SCCL) TaxID=418459 RepID=H6QPI2_PUCGT|nr:uncharacterized protein PGTG_20849 [Puccinia graminis f. sp. tritici CRL 75-36-700-3]EHS63867.1 hypothetical protein PGTG_20849 [Puccinia graminis f. sp. tritici CRL 75-36-700-3]